MEQVLLWIIVGWGCNPEAFWSGGTQSITLLKFPRDLEQFLTF